MGGNAFQDLEPLTPQEYTQIVEKITAVIAPICVLLEPYIPLPEKTQHGDIDFLLVLKPGHSLSSIRDLLGIEKEKYKINNNLTANSAYFNKQIDFNQAEDQHDFELCRFYKSYGGIGAFLGLFLPSKWVKLNEAGIVGCAYHEHIKLEHLLCSDINKILQFYGLDSQRYHKGFENRVSLFAFLRKNRFLNEHTFIEHTTKHQTKLMRAFQDWIIKEGPEVNPHYLKWEDPLSAALKHFNKQEQFDAAWKKKLTQEENKKTRANKWNGLHIMKVFGVDSKSVNGYKKQFIKTFPSFDAYEQYLDETAFEQIIASFGKVCGLVPTQQE